MGSIIDSFFIALGYDTSGMEEGERRANQSFKNAKEGMHGFGSQVEVSAKSSDMFLGKLQSRALGLFAIFSAGKGIKDFTADINKQNVIVGRASTLLDTTTSKLSSWMNIAGATGGNPLGVGQSIAGLNQQLQQMSLTGDSAILPFLRSLNIDIEGANGQIINAVDLLPKLAQALHGMHDAARATAVGRGLGLSDDLIYILLQGDKALKNYMEDQRRWGTITDEQSRLSLELAYSTHGVEQSFESLWRQVVQRSSPGIIEMNKALTELFISMRNSGVVNSIFDHLDGSVKKAREEIARFKKIHDDNQAKGPTQARKDLLERGAKKDALDKASPKNDKLAEVLQEAFFWAIGRENKLGEANVEFKKILEKDRLARAAIDESTVKENKLALHGLFGPLGRFIEWLAGPVDEAEQKKRDADRNIGGNVGGAIGGYVSTGGGKAMSPKQQQEQIAKDVAYYQSKGWRREQAIGIVANLYSESGGNHTIPGDGGEAYGLAQWHPDRQAKFAEVYGHDIRKSTRQEQLDFVDWELRHTEADAGRRILLTNRADTAGATGSKYYERPGRTVEEQETAARNRAAYADEIDRMLRERERTGKLAHERVPDVPQDTTPAPEDFRYGAPSAAEASHGASNDNSRTTTISTTINGGINVNSPDGSNGKQVGRDIKETLDHDSMALHAEYGYL